MRPVTVFGYQRPEGSAYSTPYDKVEIGKGIFHQWGQESEENDLGPIHSCVAIVEMPDGSVETVYAHMIKFDDV